jgi:hypothetical protein
MKFLIFPAFLFLVTVGFISSLVTGKASFPLPEPFIPGNEISD